MRFSLDRDLFSGQRYPLFEQLTPSIYSVSFVVVVFDFCVFFLCLFDSSIGFTSFDFDG